MTIKLDGTDGKTTLKRCLDQVLSVSLKKFKMKQAKNSDRQSWGRLIVQAVKAYSDLIDSEQIEKIEADIQQIKEKIGMKET